MRRRKFLLGTGGWLACGGGLGARSRLETWDQGRAPPAWSVTPVVGDGRWIWTRPPADERGYLEGRRYRLRVGIEWEGTGPATNILSTTTVPVAHPEQTIERQSIVRRGGDGQVRKLADGAGQLIAGVASLVRGQVASVTVEQELTLFKQFHAYQRDQFPERQILDPATRQTYLLNSPGIETNSANVRGLVKELGGGSEHPWDWAQRCFTWVHENIRPLPGPYTSVVQALEQRRGDCEEMAGVMIALCRAVNIPARIVWVPNHAWAEFYLVDHEGRGHWIPAHTASYHWFGYTGAHELVLQKGDRVPVPERKKTLRLLEDWTRSTGSPPRVRYMAELTPLPPENDTDAGPGARRKIESGEWLVVGDHPLDRYVRR